MKNMTMGACEESTSLSEIRALLHDDLFSDSKDWREGSCSERIKWLLSMYNSAKQEVARLENIVRLET